MLLPYSLLMKIRKNSYVTFLLFLLAGRKHQYIITQKGRLPQMWKPALFCRASAHLRNAQFSSSHLNAFCLFLCLRGARKCYMKHTILYFCFDLVFLNVVRQRQSLLVVAV